MRSTQTIPEWRTIADEIWVMLRESARRHEETDKHLQAASLKMEETDRQIKETDRQMKETSRQMKETDRRFSEFSNRFGEIVEHMVVPNLVSKFRELDFEFTKAGPDVVIKDAKHNIFLEVDAFLENGDKVMIVEIKSKPNNRDVNDHVKRMEKLRKYADLRKDSRNYLGVVAGVVFSDSVKSYALKQGFYVIEPSGETFSITEPGGKYHPHIW